MKLLRELMRQRCDGAARTNGPLFERLDTAENLKRLRRLSILLFVGRGNAVVSPAAIEWACDTLCDALCDALSGRNARGDKGASPRYTYRAVLDYSHHNCWIGRNVFRDVYPIVELYGKLKL